MSTVPDTSSEYYKRALARLHYIQAEGRCIAPNGSLIAIGELQSGIGTVCAFIREDRAGYMVSVELLNKRTGQAERLADGVSTLAEF